MKEKRKKNFNCSTPFPDTGKMALSYQLGRGYWDFGDLSAQRGVYDLPKHTVLVYFFIIYRLLSIAPQTGYRTIEYYIYYYILLF